MADKSALLCPQCQIGHLQPSHQSYVRVIDGMVMSVADMPVLTCDVCGFHEFEASAVAQVEALVGQNEQASLPARAPQRARRIDGKSTQGLKG